MSRIHSPVLRRSTYACALALAILITGCGGGADLVPRLAGEDPSDSEIVFSIPQEGATIDRSVVISAAGDAIQSVLFEVDDQEMSRDADAPFAWTLYPNAFAEGSHQITVTATTEEGDESVSLTLITQQTSSPSSPDTGPDQPENIVEALKELPSGHWLEIPNTQLTDVKPNPKPDGNFKNIIAAWSGGAFDTQRERLVIWGGGHADYAGNELYAFDMNSLQWKRLTEPSAFPANDPTNSASKTTHPDGRPVSRHTYEYLEYIPEPTDRFFAGGGAGLWRSGQFGDKTTWLFDFESNEWTGKSDCPERGIWAISAIDASGHVWQHTNGLAAYNPQTDVWTQHTKQDGMDGRYCTAEIDPKRNRFYVVGRDRTVLYQLDAENIEPQVVQTTGDRSIESGKWVGFAYHKQSEQLVAWKSGSDVYVLDTGTHNWTKVQARNAVSPGDSNRTFGRFRYSPKYNVFVLCTAVDKNVFVYRLPEP